MRIDVPFLQELEDRPQGVEEGLATARHDRPLEGVHEVVAQRSRSTYGNLVGVDRAKAREHVVHDLPGRTRQARLAGACGGARDAGNAPTRQPPGQVRRQRDRLVDRNPLAVHRDREAEELVARLRQRIRDRGQRRYVGRRVRLVVEADHRHVLGDAQPRVHERLHRPDRGLVVAGQHGRQGGAARDDVPHRSTPPDAIVHPVRDEPLVGHETELADSLQVGAEPLAAVTPVVGLAGDERDALVAVLDQVLESQANARPVLDGDVRAVRLRAEEGDGKRRTAKIVDVRPGDVGTERRNHDQRVRVPVAYRHDVRSGPGQRPRGLHVRGRVDSLDAGTDHEVAVVVRGCP